jgi:pimeloyl-ACP methyl ester carboxylesterase
MPEITLDFQTFGDAKNPALLLIMGLATQRTAWPDSWIQRFVDKGFFVITFDNRDVGLSSRLDYLGAPSFPKIACQRLFGLGAPPPYTLSDMAQDALDLLDRLGVVRAHIFGISMGGMIAQHLCLKAPQRALSLTLLMSSSGRIALPLPHRSVLKIFASKPKAGLTDKEAAADYLLRFFAEVGSPAYPIPESERAPRVWAQVNRSMAGMGANRHIAAIIADGKRHKALRNLRLPVLVLHGDSDKLLPPTHGRDLANKIPGARFELLKGVGHDVPDGLADLIAARVADLAQRDR